MSRERRRLYVPVPTPECKDSVLVPRALAEEMSHAIAAMQALAAEGMQEVAKTLGLAARRRRTPPPPPCASCGIEVGLGFTHRQECPSPEAVRHRATAVPRVVES